MKKDFVSRKDSMILAAIDIISENGVQGLSTKEIAAKQGISESLLYKHFKSIDEVLVAVVAYFGRFDTMIFNTMLKRNISYKEKILGSVESFIELYENYPSLAAIVLNYETLMHYEHTKDSMRKIIEGRSAFMVELIERGQNAGEIKDYFSAQELADIVLGLTKTIILRWKMGDYKFSVKECMLATIKKVLDKC
ncbi:MAG: TetR/AcrR family transcriptional regulator [Bacillota bacterium]